MKLGHFSLGWLNETFIWLWNHSWVCALNSLQNRKQKQKLQANPVATHIQIHKQIKGGPYILFWDSICTQTFQNKQLNSSDNINQVPAEGGYLNTSKPKKKRKNN